LGGCFPASRAGLAVCSRRRPPLRPTPALSQLIPTSPVHPTCPTSDEELSPREGVPTQPAGNPAWLTSPTGALPHGKLCWGLAAPRTHSLGAGCQHPGCTEPRRGLVSINRSLLSPFHLLPPSWAALTLSQPQLQPKAAIKQPTLLPSCPLPAPAHTVGLGVSTHTLCW